jgi:hypothetical protein
MDSARAPLSQPAGPAREEDQQGQRLFARGQTAQGQRMPWAVTLLSMRWRSRIVRLPAHHQFRLLDRAGNQHCRADTPAPPQRRQQFISATFVEHHIDQRDIEAPLRRASLITVCSRDHLGTTHRERRPAVPIISRSASSSSTTRMRAVSSGVGWLTTWLPLA